MHSVLWNEWDPIHVNGIFDGLVEIDPETGREIGHASPDVRDQEWPDDEYDNYVWGVLNLLDRGGDAGGVAEYLEQAETRSMGITTNDQKARNDHLLALGQKIVALRDKG